jgi:hypothetical protein
MIKYFIQNYTNPSNPIWYNKALLLLAIPSKAFIVKSWLSKPLTGFHNKRFWWKRV